MKKLFSVFVITILFLTSCRKKEHSITYEVTTEFQADSIGVGTVVQIGNNQQTNYVSINSNHWKKTVDNANIEQGTSYNFLAVYYGVENPGKINLKLYLDDNIISESTVEPQILNDGLYYGEAACYYQF